MRRVSLVALTLAGGAAAQQAAAQDVAAVSESTLTATISQSIEADTNYDLENAPRAPPSFGDTRLELGLARETETQSLCSGLNTGLRALDQADEPFEFMLASPSRRAARLRGRGRQLRLRHRRGCALASASTGFRHLRRPDLHRRGLSTRRAARRRHADQRQHLPAALRPRHRLHQGHQLPERLHALRLLRHRYRLFRRLPRGLRAAPLRTRGHPAPGGCASTRCSRASSLAGY